MSYYCYILRSLNSSFQNNTYVGKTNNPTRRIRQHNGEIVGGAKATSSKRPYKMYCIIEGFQTEHDALSYEWNIKHPTRKKIVPKTYHGTCGRVLGLKKVLQDRPPQYPIKIHIEKEFENLLDDMNKENIEIILIE